MTARFETRRGERVLILDIPYRRPDGTSARYRRDSAAATLTAAREEDRRIRDRIAKTGSPFEEQAVEPEKPKNFSELVSDYRSKYLPSLKRSTRRGYESVLDIHLVPNFGDLPVIEVSAQVASTLDLKLAKTHGVKAGTTKTKNTRNNIQIVLRSVLRFGSKHGYLTEVPGALPRLKRGGDLLHQAFSRATTRAEIDGFTVYSLRHYAITLWLRAGVPVHVVQRMAGHKHLATAARYVHLLRGDLDEAAVRIGNMLATASAGSPTDPTPSAA